MTFKPSIQWSTSPRWTCEVAQTESGRVALAKTSSPLLQKLGEQVEVSRQNKTSNGTAPTSLATDSWPPLEPNNLPTLWMPDTHEPARLTTLAPPFQPILEQVESELENRLGLLKQQWLARSPGIWNWLSKRPVIANCLQSSLMVATTLPLFGGQAWPLRNRPGAVVETVLFDPVPPLPEVLRILQALLHSQLDCHCPGQSSEIHFQISSILALAVGDHVELTTLEPATWKLALEHWSGPDQILLTQAPTVADVSLPTFAEIDTWLASKIDAK